MQKGEIYHYVMKVCKIKIYPNKSQIKLINNTLGCCRHVKNMYIEYNINRYKDIGEFISGYDFSKILNKLKKTSENYLWIANCSSKAIKDAIMEEEKAFKSFFKKKGGFPKFKSRKRINKESFFFVKNNVKYIDKYHIKIPIVGKLRILQSSYLPDITTITSGRVIREYNDYYIMLVYNNKPNYISCNNFKMGIDLGIKNYASIYLDNDIRRVVSHFKDLPKYKSIYNKITRLQQILSKKVEINYYRKLNQYFDKHHEEPNEQTKRIMKGESYHTSRIRNLRRKIRKLHKKLDNIRKDFIDKLVYKIVARTKPRVITIEDLSISNMICDGKNKDLHRYIAESGFYYFRTHLINKCNEMGIELHIADKYFASSKKCCICGHKKKDLKLTDRVYSCPKCGFTIDRDMNAAINLCNLKKDFIVITPEATQV